MLESRYKCCSYYDDRPSPSESIQDLERFSFIRWLVLLFATLPIAIKIFAPKGTPLTTGAVTIYLAQYLVVELLILLIDRHPAFTLDGRPNILSLAYDTAERADKWLSSVKDVVSLIFFHFPQWERRLESSAFIGIAFLRIASITAFELFYLWTLSKEVYRLWTASSPAAGRERGSKTTVFSTPATNLNLLATCLTFVLTIIT